MSLNDLNDGFERYLNQNFSVDEQRQFFSWLAKENNEEKVKQFLFDRLNSFSANTELKDVDFDSIYNNIIDEIGVSDKTAPSFAIRLKQAGISILKVAAIAVIVLFSTFFIHKIVTSKKQQVLSLAYYEVRAPMGAKTEITLPDGSHVWLNAGSKIKYNSGFSIQNRNISLDGEAFFKVAKNNVIPFIVKTSDIDIKAVGTAFNVKAYSDEGTIETTLVEGKIAIIQSGKTITSSSEFFLEPNQKATFVKEKTTFDLTDVRKFKEELPPQIKVETGKVYINPKVDPTSNIAWKENQMIIRGEAMESLVIKLERKYDVEIEIESDYVKDYRFSGTLDDETLQQVLDVIKLSAPIDYTIEGKLVTIKENSILKKKFKRYLKDNN